MSKRKLLASVLPQTCICQDRPFMIIIHLVLPHLEKTDLEPKIKPYPGMMVNPSTAAEALKEKHIELLKVVLSKTIQHGHQSNLTMSVVNV